MLRVQKFLVNPVALELRIGHRLIFGVIICRAPRVPLQIILPGVIVISLRQRHL